MHWSQTESSKWSCNCLSRRLGHPFKVLYNPRDSITRGEALKRTTAASGPGALHSVCARLGGRRATSNAGAAPLTRAVQRLGGPTLLTIAHIVPALYECRVLLREVRGCHVLVGAVERVLGPVAANSARGEHGLDRRTQRRSHLLGMEPLPVDTAEEGVRLEQ